MADNETEQTAAATAEKDNKSKYVYTYMNCPKSLYIFHLFAVCILLNATGNVPIIKKRTWTVDPYKKVSWIQKFIHKYLKLDPSEQIVSKPLPNSNQIYDLITDYFYSLPSFCT